MKIAVVITTYNEAKTGWRERQLPDGSKVMAFEDELSEKYDGNELRATIESVRHNTKVPVSIVVVDDGSDDHCADGLDREGVTVIRHKKRIGIGFSRTEGVKSIPSDTDAVMFLDAHQRVSACCIEHCCRLAVENQCVTWPDTRGLRDRPRWTQVPRGRVQETWTGHAARPRTIPGRKEQKEGNGRRYFQASWIIDAPMDKISRTSALISPGYAMPLSVWKQLEISTLTRGFGANEPMLWVKCFFLDIPILHTCHAMVRHLFRATTGHYRIGLGEVYRNMAILARTCFDDATWRNWWWPSVFDCEFLDRDARAVLESAQMREEHLAFQSAKKRTDSQFWRGLCLENPPIEGLS